MVRTAPKTKSRTAASVPTLSQRVTALESKFRKLSANLPAHGISSVAAHIAPLRDYLTLSIGAPLPGGIFAGITYVDAKPYALVLGPEHEAELDWNAFSTWLKTLSVDGCTDFVMPSKLDGILLWSNLRPQFQKSAHWLEQHAECSGSAWCQDFYSGHQNRWLKGSKLRCRAVRRIPLSHSAL